jgi:hypothetical protein
MPIFRFLSATNSSIRQNQPYLFYSMVQIHWNKKYFENPHIRVLHLTLFLTKWS